jgi:Ca2+/Na+ antiporter
MRQVLSALLGAALLVTTCVLGTVILMETQGSKQMSRPHFLRDATLYTAVVVSTIVVTYSGVIYLWQAVTLLLMYAVYVTTIIVEFKRSQHKRRHHPLMEGEGHREAWLLAGNDPNGGSQAEIDGRTADRNLLFWQRMLMSSQTPRSRGSSVGWTKKSSSPSVSRMDSKKKSPPLS